MGLDPINSPVKDEVSMNVLRLESRLASVLDYVAQLKVTLSQINKELWPEDVPYTMKKGVRSVDRFGVVLSPHRTDGNSVIEAPVACLRLHISRGFNP